MEFYVVDPKDRNFGQWAGCVREFLEAEQLEHTEKQGGLYYLGDDIASPWSEDSILFTVEGESGGVIELRDSDREFYCFGGELSAFDSREVFDATGYHARRAGPAYGFRWGDTSGCRFHLGPSPDLHFFCDDTYADFPPVLGLTEVWQTFFRSMQWLGNGMSRVQDITRVHVERVFVDLEVDLQFAHPASMTVFTELLAGEEGYERTKTVLRARFRDRSLSWIRDFVAMLPTEPDAFVEMLVRVVWRGIGDGKNREVIYVGVEKRNLRPFVQMPVQRTTRSLLDRFRTYFKGHRIDRQEYYLPPPGEPKTD